MIVHEDKNVSDKLNLFLKTNKIPNIIFHGPSGSGKRTLIHNFISEIYNHDKKLIEKNTLYSNCAHCKGIKFIREDLKFFAKTHIKNKKSNTNSTVNSTVNSTAKTQQLFKIIIMSNASELTTDAQSALRRCIEVFNHTTRFFFITENKSALMTPILSRFCDIYIPEPIIKGVCVNYHIKNITDSNYVKNFASMQIKRNKWLKIYLNKIDDWNTMKILKISLALYENGYSGLDIMNYIQEKKMDNAIKWKLLTMFDKIKNNIRSEKQLIYIMLFTSFLRSNVDLENISFM